MMTKYEPPLGLLGLSIIVSVAIHLLLFWISNISFSPSQPTDAMEKTTDIQWVQLPEKRFKQKIVDLPTPQNISDQNVKTPYLSEQNTIAPKQTVAPPSGRQPKQTETTMPRPKETNTSALALSEEKLTHILSQSSPTPSVSFNPNNYLPEIQIGEETMLSTQRFAYATYFNRMKRAIQVYWHPPTSLIQHNRNKKTWISTMLIVLNAQGELTHQQIINSSGARQLDAYAMQAVAKAAPFYNPPEVLLDESKEIRMNWSFIFEASRL